MNEARQNRIAELKANRFAKLSGEERKQMFREAVTHGDLPMIRVCLESGMKPRDVGFEGKSLGDSTLQPLKKEVWKLFLEFEVPFPCDAIVQSAGYGTSNVEDIEFLLDNEVGGRSESLLDPIIVGGGNENVLRVLLQRGADVNCRDNHGATPLMVSVCYWNESRKSVLLLLEFGADVKATDKEGKTVLDYADVDAASVKRFINRYAQD